RGVGILQSIDDEDGQARGPNPMNEGGDGAGIQRAYRALEVRSGNDLEPLVLLVTSARRRGNGGEAFLVVKGVVLQFKDPDLHSARRGRDSEERRAQHHRPTEIEGNPTLTDLAPADEDGDLERGEHPAAKEAYGLFD